MENDSLKNIIILKNLPSNILEEAIIVVKDKNRIINKDFFKKSKNIKSDTAEDIIQGYMNESDFKKIEKNQKESREFVVKEAEMIVGDYLNRIEENKNHIDDDKLKKRCCYLKYLNGILVAMSFISTLICVLK